MQIGHRISEDIDLFTRQDINKDEIIDFMNKKFAGNVQITNIQNLILQMVVNGVKVDFVKYDFPLIEEVFNEDGVKYLGIKDISAMKLLATANRGNHAKDFVDIFFLLKKMSLTEMFDYFRQKFNQIDVSIIKRSLIYFDDVPKGSWSAIKYLQEKPSTEAIKRKIISCLKGYRKY
ncbi:MAG: nucleotidyl transferase AbiEii/AbiGii toxin family protein [Fibromonadales bacterium]|nr:nucleotidyl transferase AbiEii/AbiGii toxin family protein [Fibromonadales bacterium]